MQKEFIYNKGEVRAKMVYTSPDQFTLKKGTRISDRYKPGCPQEIIVSVNQLIQKGDIIHGILQKDLEFNDINTCISVVNKADLNGELLFKTSNGIFFRDWKKNLKEEKTVDNVNKLERLQTLLEGVNEIGDIISSVVGSLETDVNDSLVELEILETVNEQLKKEIAKKDLEIKRLQEENTEFKKQKEILKNIFGGK